MNEDGKEILYWNRQHIGVGVWQCSATCFAVRWTDYVANDWEREFASLSTALAFLAFLMRCEEKDWELYEGSGSFSAKFDSFIDDVAASK